MNRAAMVCRGMYGGLQWYVVLEILVPFAKQWLRDKGTPAIAVIRTKRPCSTWDLDDEL